MDALIIQLLNGLDKGAAYALIALGLTLVFGTLGVVNFAHGALFMFGAFGAVTFNRVLAAPVELPKAEGELFAQTVPWAVQKFGETGQFMIDYSVPLSLIVVIPFMLLVGVIIERGLIKHFYKREHADQILVTFGLAIVMGEISRHFYGASAQSMSAPEAFRAVARVGEWVGLSSSIVYPWWRLIFFLFAAIVISGVFAFLQFTTFGMVVRAGMQDREMVGLLGINIQKRFTIIFGLAAVVAGATGAMYTPIIAPDYNIGMEFLVLSFVVVVVGGMGSLGGAVAAGFMLGLLQSITSMQEVKNILPGIDQVIIYLVAVIILLTLPRGLMGRKGIFED